MPGAGLPPILVQVAINNVNKVLNAGDTLEKSNVDSYCHTMKLLNQSFVAVCSPTRHPDSQTLIDALINVMKACLPLAEAINQAQSKLRAGTFKIFERDGASLREIDVHVGFGKIEALLLGGSVCLTAVTLLLETLGNNSLGRRQTTNFTDEQFLTMLGVINLPFDLLLHENGLQVVSTRLFAPNVDASNPAMLAMGCCFSSLLRRFNASFDLSFKLLDVYARWHDIHADEDATASDISRGLPRPLCLTADAITSALIQHTVNFDMALKHPGLCHIAEDAIARQTNTIFALEKGQAKLDIALKFWEAQLKRDLFTTTFFRFIKEWKCSKFAQNSYRIELKIPFFVFALIREINEVDDVEVHRRTLTSLSSRDDLKPLVNAALEMLEYSKDSSRDEGERVEPEKRCRNMLASITEVAFFEASEALLEFQQIQEVIIVSPVLLLAIFKAQEAVSTLIALGSWVFTTYFPQDESSLEGFDASKKPVYDITKSAMLLGCRLEYLTLSNIRRAAFIRVESDELCEAGLKAVEAASKALLLGWSMSPKKILALSEQIKSNIDPFTEDELKSSEETVSMAIDLHRATGYTMCVALMCCRNPISPELAKKIGAVALKAIYAMEVKPNDDWKDFIMVFEGAVRASDTIIPGVVQLRPNNTIFETAIAPVLANHEPWLENAVNMNLDGKILNGPPEESREFMMKCKEILDKAMEALFYDASGEERKKRAVARAHAMATMRCGYVGCCTIMLPDQKSKRCGGCKVVRYCSEKCLKADWKTNHRVACKAIAAGEH